MIRNGFIALLTLLFTLSVQAGERIVAAGGSLVELIYALDAGGRMVGVDETTTWPPQTAALPHIGYWKQLSSESILSLCPDLFITWQDAEPKIVLEQLQTHKVNVLTLPRIPATVDQMYANIQALAAALNQPQKGAALVDDIRQRLEKVAHSNAAKPAPVSALFLLSAGGSAPQVAGAGSVAGAILAMAGAHNAARHEQYKTYSAEALIAADPQVIVVTSEMAPGSDFSRISTIAGITRTSAWKNQRLIAIDQALILGMGPRVADAVEQLHRQLWP